MTYNKLSKDEKAIVEESGLSKETYNRRMKNHWTKDNAMYLPPEFKRVGNQYIRRLYVDSIEIQVSVKNHYKMRAKGLTDEDVMNRIANGATLEMSIACSPGRSVFDKTYQERVAMYLEKERTVNYCDLLFQQSCRQFLEAK